MMGAEEAASRRLQHKMALIVFIGLLGLRKEKVLGGPKFHASFCRIRYKFRANTFFREGAAPGSISHTP
jgi:hypothetical protein